jgi:hypothetical protein
MFTVGLDLSPRQMAKLRKGNPVRVKKGMGCNLIVNPNNYDIMNRAFRRNKGVQLKLSPEEIQMNTAPSPEEQQALMAETNQDLASPNAVGMGLGGKLSLKSVGRTLSKVEKNPVFRKVVKEVAPMLAEKGTRAGLKYFGVDDKTAKELSTGVSRGTKSGLQAQGYGLGAGLGTGLYTGRGGFDRLARATKGELMSGTRAMDFDRRRVEGMYHTKPYKPYWDGEMDPPSRGTSGSGLGAGIRGGGFLSGNGHMPQALMPQPYTANYHFKFFLPPAYQNPEDME